MKRSSWTIRFSPQLSDWCPPKKHTGENTDMDVKAEAEVGAM